jgi:uncharacterized protein YceH (UPF0502 family)
LHDPQFRTKVGSQHKPIEINIAIPDEHSQTQGQRSQFEPVLSLQTLEVQPRRTGVRHHVVVQNLSEILAAFAFFGGVVIVPIVYMLLKHQRAITEVMHNAPAAESQRRIEALEHEVAQLRAMHHELIIRDDDRQSLTRDNR